MKKYVIGMDIGGTNTDAVLVDDQERIVQAVKTSTTDDISQGFSLALQQPLDKGHCSRSDRGHFSRDNTRYQCDLTKKGPVSRRHHTHCGPTP